MEGTRINELPTGTPDSLSYLPFDNGTTTQKIKVNDLKPYKTTISLPTASWSGSASPYSQTVTLSGYTATSNTKVDVQGDTTLLQQLLDDGTNALFIGNNSGTLTAYAVGEKPSVNLTVQATITEVIS